MELEKKKTEKKKIVKKSGRKPGRPRKVDQETSIKEIPTPQAFLNIVSSILMYF